MAQPSRSLVKMEITSIQESTINRPALGRHVQLGMLYDCMTDTILTDCTLWSTRKIENGKTVKPHKSSNFDALKTCSTEEKAKVMHIKPDTLLSCYSDLIQPGGAAQFLNKKPPPAQKQIGIHYQCTTRLEQVPTTFFKKDSEPPRSSRSKLRRAVGPNRSSNVSGKVDSSHSSDAAMTKPPLLMNTGDSRRTDDEHASATHVVSGIVYGGTAFFVFKHSKKKQGALIRAMKLLNSNISVDNLVDDSAAVGRFENALQNAGMEECEMYSDFHPSQEQPLLCSHFTHTYRELLRQLSCVDMNTVPVTLCLTPLTMFNENAKNVKCEVSPHVVSQIETLLLNHHACDRALLDLLMSQSSLYFDYISTDTNILREKNQEFLILLKQKLSMILPQIRCGDVEEIDMPIMLQKYLTSNKQAVMLDQYEQHVASVRSLDRMVHKMASIDSIDYVDLSQILTDSEDTTLICLIHSNLRTTQDEMVNDPVTDSALAIIPAQASPSGAVFKGLAAKLKICLSNFHDIVTANKDKSELKYFLVKCGKVDGDLPGDAGQHESVCINVYMNGKLAQRNYVPPSRPGQPLLVKSTHDSITVSWDPSMCNGNETEVYEIHCRRIGSPINQAQILHSNGPDLDHTITGLQIAATYEVKVRAIFQFHMSAFSATSRPLKTQPSAPPEKPDVLQASPLSVKVSWKKPMLARGDCPSGCTIIAKDIDSGLSTRHTVRSDNQESEIQVEPRKTYRFSLCLDFLTGNKSMPSEESEAITVEATDEQCMKYNVLHRSDKVRSSAALPTHQIALERVTGTATSMNSKFEFGKAVTGQTEKVIMVVGATGAGKTSLLNSMINYILGVDFRDKYHFRLVREDLAASNQAVSQTQHIIAYTLHHQKGFRVPYTLTIIDTPGFGDTSGINRDKQITKELHRFFSLTGSYGIDHIDAIGFVVQTSLPRLTATQRYIFDSILSIFGRDIEENIFLLVTFADGKKPPVLASIKQAEIAYKKFYKFNNSAIFSDSLPDEDDEEDDGFDEMFWNMGMKSFKTFFTDLQQVESKSLQLTKDVLDERSRLELNVTQIQIDIKLGLNKLGQLDIELQFLRNHRCETERNKDFTYEVTEDTVVKLDIPCGQHTTTCLRCNRTCHEICGIPDDAGKALCWAMTDNYCRICPGKCIWNMHKNLPYVLKVQSQIVTKTADDLKARYEAAQGKCLNAEQLIAAVYDEFEEIQLKVLYLTEEVRKSIERLQHIALKPHPLSALGYIDVLIDAERYEGHAGWRQRVQQLQDVRRTAEHMQSIARPDYDPFEEYRDKVREAQKKRKSPSGWTAAHQHLKKVCFWAGNKLNF